MRSELVQNIQVLVPVPRSAGSAGGAIFDSLHPMSTLCAFFFRFSRECIQNVSWAKFSDFVDGLGHTL